MGLYGFVLRGLCMSAALVLVGAAVHAQDNKAAPGAPPAAAAVTQPPAPAAWRVECGGDGKTLDCLALQQLITREDKQLVVQAVARVGADKMPVLVLQLPLGLNVAEPVVLKIDGGKEEKQPIQTCAATGCYVTVPLKEPMLGAMRNGQVLKITLQDNSKRSIAIDLPLLGFGLAFDKATK